MEAEVPARKKEPTKRATVKKSYIALSDTEDEVGDDEDEDFAVEEAAAPPEVTKKGGRKAAGNAKAAAKPPAAVKKRGQSKKQPQAVGQKILTDMLKPSENSPEKKVRKMRESPFNKKSGSVLGKAGITQDEVTTTSGSSASSSDSIEEVAAVGSAATRPKRANSRRPTYVLSDSESDQASEDSDFNEDED